MSARPRFSADQKQIALAVRDELLMMFGDVMRASQVAVALEGVCGHYGLPQLDGELRSTLGAAVLAVEAAHAAYGEFSAALSVQTGDAGEGASALSPAEPLKAAA
jgi:hypothetical protein